MQLSKFQRRVVKTVRKHFPEAKIARATIPISVFVIPHKTKEMCSYFYFNIPCHIVLLPRPVTSILESHCYRD